MKIQFKQYLHDEWEDPDFETMFKDTPLLDLPQDELDALMQKVGRPFYEVTLYCELDTETGEVTVMRTKL